MKSSLVTVAAVLALSACAGTDRVAGPSSTTVAARNMNGAPPVAEQPFEIDIPLCGTMVHLYTDGKFKFIDLGSKFRQIYPNNVVSLTNLANGKSVEVFGRGQLTGRPQGDAFVAELRGRVVILDPESGKAELYIGAWDELYTMQGFQGRTGNGRIEDLCASII